jgi:prolyl 4-hydroxylase
MEKQLIAENPVIYTVDDILTHEECQRIIEFAKPHMKIAGVSVMPGQKGFEKGAYKGRTNRSYWVEKSAFPDICERIAKMMGCSVDHFESMQVIHYNVGEEYKFHYDAYNPTEPEKYKRFCKERGNRLKTALVYLNDVEEGGGTAFNKILPFGEHLIVNPKQGRVVVFHNVNHDKSPNKYSMHAGLPVIKGEKWAFNLWLREV